MNDEIIVLLFNLLLTFIIYEIVPLILRCIFKKQYTQKQAKKIAIINSVVVYLLFAVLYIVLDIDKTPNVSASFIWGYVSYYFLKLSKKEKNEIAQVSRKFMILVVALMVIIMLVICLYIYDNFSNNYEKLYESYGNVKINLEQLQEDYRELKKTNYELNNKILDYEDKVNFVDNCVVIVPKNTNIYHRYDCQYLDKNSLALVFNIENARGQGYIPCKNCIK